MLDTLTDHVCSTDPLWGQRPKPDAPATRTDWLLAMDEDADRCCDLATRFVDMLDKGDTETLLMGTKEDREELRRQFMEWVQRNW